MRAMFMDPFFTEEHLFARLFWLLFIVCIWIPGMALSVYRSLRIV